MDYIFNGLGVFAAVSVAILGIFEYRRYGVGLRMDAKVLNSTQMLGSFAEYFSESLATHVRKGQGQRALEGRHLGGIPFGYASCWAGSDGGRVVGLRPGA